MNGSFYFIDEQGNQQGPVVLSELARHGVGPDTLIWTKGMPQWQRAAEVIVLPTSPSTKPYVNNVPDNQNPNIGYTDLQATQHPSTRPQSNTNNPPPDNYLIWAILSTLLCCLPLGIVAIVYSSKVNTFWEKHEYSVAENYSQKAKMWCLIAAGIGIFSIVISTLIFFLLAFAG